MTRIGGIVLCGGQSSRMGRPKAWLPFGGEFMLQWVARVLREVVDPVVVVAAPGQDVPPLPTEVQIVRDEIEGKGPLGGLAAGLAALEGKADAVYLSSCDVPFLKPEFVRRVVERLEEPNPLTPFPPREGGILSFSPSPLGGGGRGEGFFAAVPHVDGHFHPLAAAYRLSVLPNVRQLLAADQLRMMSLFEIIPMRTIEPHELADIDPGLSSLRNLNTPDDYEAARLQSSQPPTDH